MGSDTESTNDTDRMAAWLAPFRRAFTAPTWRRVLVLASGAILSRTQDRLFGITGSGFVGCQGLFVVSSCPELRSLECP